jgi:hypothetical protein
MKTNASPSAKKNNSAAFQNFLRNAAAITLFAAPYVASMTPTKAHAIDLSTSGTYTQDFDSLASLGTTASASALSAGAWTDNSTITGWFAQFGGTARFAIGNGTTESTTGGVFFYGTNGSTDRALGDVGSGTPKGIAFGVLFKNTALTNLTFTSLGYTLEQWRNGGSGTAQDLNMSYQISPSTISSLSPSTTTATENNTNYTTLPSTFNLASPINTASVAGLDGNATANKVVLSSATALPASITLTPGQFIMFRWSDVDDTGADSGLAIDNVSISYIVATSGGSFYNGGAGTWSSSSTNFSTSAALGGSLIQDSASTSALTFGGTSAGTVTISGTVTVPAGITFGTSGYSFTGGTIALTGGSATANTITIDGTGSTASIASTLTGTNGLTKAGTGSLLLSGANTYSYT